MKLLLDTNIIVDVLSRRTDYASSAQVLRFCETFLAEGYVSATTVTNVMYILRKHIDPQAVRETVRKLLTIVDVASVQKSDINAAFLSGITDFEDAVQAACAQRIKADYIVTRNIKDFTSSPVTAILPQDVLEILQQA